MCTLNVSVRTVGLVLFAASWCGWAPSVLSITTDLSRDGDAVKHLSVLAAQMTRLVLAAVLSSKITMLHS